MMCCAHAYVGACSAGGGVGGSSGGGGGWTPGSGGGGSLSLFTEEEESAKMEPTKEYLLDGRGASSAGTGILAKPKPVRGGEIVWSEPPRGRCAT